MKRSNWLKLLSLASILSLSFMSHVAVAAEEAMKPCHDDVQKFCADVKPGGGKVAQCLKEHEADLSQACKAHMKAIREHMEEAREACHDDAAKLCKDVKPGHGRMMGCLKQHEGELSEGCKAEMKGNKR